MLRGGIGGTIVNITKLCCTTRARQYTKWTLLMTFCCLDLPSKTEIRTMNSEIEIPRRTRHWRLCSDVWWIPRLLIRETRNQQPAVISRNRKLNINRRTYFVFVFFRTGSQQLRLQTFETLILNAQDQMIKQSASEVLKSNEYLAGIQELLPEEIPIRISKS